MSGGQYIRDDWICIFCTRPLQAHFAFGQLEIVSDETNASLQQFVPQAV